jgi:hypothetical protein
LRVEQGAGGKLHRDYTDFYDKVMLGFWVARNHDTVSTTREKKGSIGHNCIYVESELLKSVSPEALDGVLTGNKWKRFRKKWPK